MAFPGNPSSRAVGASATPVWSGTAGSLPVLLINTDPSNDVFAGYSSTIAIGGTDTTDIPPLGSVSMDGSKTIYAVAANGTNPLQVVPGGSNWSQSPAAVASQIIASGLAELIAQQISQSGIGLFGNPELVYSYGSVPVTGAALVGETVPTQALQPGCYDAGLTQDQADAVFATATSRSGPNNHPAVTKKFWITSDWNTGKNNIANYAAYGTKVVFCLKPVVTSGLPLGSDFTTSGTASQIAAAQADKTSLASFLAAIKTMGFTAATAQIVLHQEPGNKSNLGAAGPTQGPVDYNNMLRTYGPTVNAAGLPLVMNVNYTGQITNATSYANAGLALRGYTGSGTGATYAGICMDFYTNSWGAGLLLDTTDGNGDSISGIANANGLPFGLNEFGCDPATFTQAQCITYLQYVLSFMAARLTAGKTNLDVIYYNGQCDATGAGDLTSPILQKTDFRVPLYQQIFDTLAQSAGGTGGTTLTANATKTLTPVSPSPVAGLGPADQMAYEIALGLTAGAGSTNPFAQVTLSFYDLDASGASQIPAEIITFSVPMGASGDPNGPLVIYGHGPMRGAFMTAKITNNDTVAATLAQFQLVGTGRTDDRHVWKYDVTAAKSPSVPGFTLAQAAQASLQIGRIESQTVAAGAVKSWLNGVWPGRAFLRVLVSGATGKNTQIQLQPQPTSIYGTQNIINEPFGISGANDEQLFTIALPRAPCLLKVNNNEATATITVSYQIIAIET